MFKWILGVAMLLSGGTCLAQESGTIILYERGLLSTAIERFTGSYYSHTVLVLDGEVYEATWPRVKKTPLKEYQAYMKRRLEKKPDLKVWVLTPNRSFCDSQVKVMKDYAETQLGKPYRLRSWLFDRPGKGLHCSQYVGLILGQIDKTFAREKHWKVSPINIYNMAGTSYTVEQLK